MKKLVFPFLVSRYLQLLYYKSKIICNNGDYAQNDEKNQNDIVTYTHSNPKEPYANISNPRHWSKNKVHNNSCYKNIIKRKHLKKDKIKLNTQTIRALEVM